MKKILTITVALFILVTIISGCGGTNEQTEGVKDTTNTNNDFENNINSDDTNTKATAKTLSSNKLLTKNTSSYDGGWDSPTALGVDVFEIIHNNDVDNFLKCVAPLNRNSGDYVKDQIKDQMIIIEGYGAPKSINLQKSTEVVETIYFDSNGTTLTRESWNDGRNKKKYEILKKNSEYQEYEKKILESFDTDKLPHNSVIVKMDKIEKDIDAEIDILFPLPKEIYEYRYRIYQEYEDEKYWVVSLEVVEINGSFYLARPDIELIGLGD